VGEGRDGIDRSLPAGDHPGRARLGPTPFAERCAPACRSRASRALVRSSPAVASSRRTARPRRARKHRERRGVRPAGLATPRGAAFSKLRLVALAERATHAMCAAAMAPCGTGENTFAREPSGSCTTGTLVFADRGLGGSDEPFSASANSGSEACWRTQDDAVLPVLERFADGSFASELSRRRTDGTGPRGSRSGRSSTRSRIPDDRALPRRRRLS
jgi:hypothetical protein